MLVCFIILRCFVRLWMHVQKIMNVWYIHNGAKSNRLEDQVFWYKANDHEDFKICCPEAWQFSQANYNEDDSDDDGDISELFKKKK